MKWAVSHEYSCLIEIQSAYQEHINDMFHRMLSTLSLRRLQFAALPLVTCRQH